MPRGGDGGIQEAGTYRLVEYIPADTFSKGGELSLEVSGSLLEDSSVEVGLQGLMVFVKDVLTTVLEKEAVVRFNRDLMRLYQFMEHISFTLKPEELKKRAVLGLFDLLAPKSVALVTLEPDSREIVVVSKRDDDDGDSEPHEFRIDFRSIREYAESESETEYETLRNWIDKFWSVPEDGSGSISMTQTVTAGDRLMGFMNIAVASESELGRENRRMIRTACKQIGISLSNASLFVQSITDGLTGLFLRRYFVDRLKNEMKRAARYDRCMSLLMIDLDFFKKVNDTYGHMVGDRVLRDVGSIIKNGLREIDIPCRYGGEEFAVLLPETNCLGAIVVAERLRKIVERDSFEVGGGVTIKLTLSIGVASFPDDANLPDFLLAKADKMLYKAKREGRNRTIVAKRPDPAPLEE